MGILKISLLLTFFFTGPAISSTATSAIPKDAIKGDFNGDGKPEYMWVVKPQLNKAEDDCIGKCIVQIVCSNPAIKPISVEQSIGGTLVNLGDLNGDGTDEIGILPDWFNGCWAAYHVYGLRNNNWLEAIPSFSVHCIQWDETAKFVKKVPGKKGFVTIRYSAMQKEQIVVKTKVVRIK